MGGKRAAGGGTPDRDLRTRARRAGNITAFLIGGKTWPVERLRAARKTSTSAMRLLLPSGGLLLLRHLPAGSASDPANRVVLP